jgi:PAS domain-containing protein
MDLQQELEIKRLQGCLNDLISVQASPPSEWTRPRGIVNTLLDALIRLLHLEFACARVNGPRMARKSKHSGPQSTVHTVSFKTAWRLRLGCATTCRQPVWTSNPVGSGDRDCSVQVRPVDEVGVVVVASDHPDFPNELEMMVLGVAANQAVIDCRRLELRRADERLQDEAQLAEGQKLSHSGGWGGTLVQGAHLSHETFGILGFDPEQPPPKFQTALGRVHADDREAVELVLGTAIRNRKDYHVETRYVLPDESARNLVFVGRPFINSSGGLEFVGTVLDITERKRAEERLAEAQAQLAHMARVTLLGELSASIAHEVNQPLGAVVTDGRACLRWINRTEPNLDEVTRRSPG